MPAGAIGRASQRRRGQSTQSPCMSASAPPPAGEVSSAPTWRSSSWATVPSRCCWRPETPPWDAKQSLVFRLADELHGTSAVSDELWLALGEPLAEDQLIEGIAHAG